VTEINVRRVEELEDDGVVLWRASLSEHDVSEVIDVHVDDAVDSADDYDVEQIVMNRVEEELAELPDDPERLGELRARSPIEITTQDLEGWEGVGRGR
jgi:hypothetical protein